MLYEVVFYGDPGTADTVYIVRAADFLAAVDLASASSHVAPDMVYEMGTDNSPHAGVPNILFGPFEANKAWDYGWRRWSRKVLEGGTISNQWEELERVI
jgi:hypothetical protein